jgi:multidrug resistance protein MdtO
MLVWFGNFLRDELAPYPGRGALITRMVIAATLVMIIGMTFRISYTFQGAIYTLIISRENPQATLRSAATVLLVTFICVAYLLASAPLFISHPLFHFLWVLCSFFLAFYLISALTNYPAAVSFAFLVALVVPLWDRYVPAETNVADTLWVVLSIMTGALVTVVVERVFVRLRPEGQILVLVNRRLTAVEKLLTCYADNRAVDVAADEDIKRLEMLGTSTLREALRRSGYSPWLSRDLRGVAALTGRLVDIAAALIQVRFEPSLEDRKRFRSVASALATIRTSFANRAIPAPVRFPADEQPSSVPLLSQIEHTVVLIPEAFAGSPASTDFLPSPDDLPQRALLAPDAFVNPEHYQFALKGCLAAGICYVFYNAVAWPGISTAVTTCMVTALSTIGASRQKQVLRVTGAVVGGFVLAMGSQIFILPYLHSIAGFTVLFVAVTAFSAWFLTSSPRLSYFGLQVALAFYLINLEIFKIQTSLADARDRVVGILLGTFAMWLVFDHLWSAPAAVEMKRAFISNLRLLARCAREPLVTDPKTAIAQNIALRETVETNLDMVRDLGDSVLFEFGSSRPQNLALRGRIRQWQPELRLIFITRIVLWRFRVPLPGFELPQPVSLAQRGFDDEVAKTLDAMADRLEDKPVAPRTSDLENSLKHLEETVRAFDRRKSPRAQPGRLETFLALSRRMEQLTSSLDAEIR